MAATLFVFAHFLAALAIALLAPALIALGGEEEGTLPAYLVTAMLWVFVAGALMLSLRGRERRLRPGQRYALAALLWAVLPLFAAAPLLLLAEGGSLLSAYFEAVSAMTTTGATLLPEPGRLHPSLVFWLALLQWLGGALTLLTVVLVLAPPGVGGLPSIRARQVEHGSPSERRRVGLVMRDILPAYCVATILCFAMLLLMGMTAFDAVHLAFITVSTGGLAPHSDALASYVPGPALLVLCVFMIYGATSIFWHRAIFQGRWQVVFGQRESWWLIGLCLGFGLLAASLFHQQDGERLLVALRDGLFTATSLITTTGLEVRPASFGILPYALVITLLSIGGASFSNAGGIKLFRVGAMLVQAGRELRRLIYPHGVRPARFGSQTYDIQSIKAIWSAFIAYLGAAIFVSLAIAADAVPYDGALLAAIAALSNAGQVYASSWAEGADWPGYAEFGPVALLAFCAGMILGRLEIIAVLALVVAARRVL